MEEHQDTITHLLDYKLVVQTKFTEYNSFVNQVIGQLQEFFKHKVVVETKFTEYNSFITKVLEQLEEFIDTFEYI